MHGPASVTSSITNVDIGRLGKRTASRSATRIAGQLGLLVSASAEVVGAIVNDDGALSQASSKLKSLKIARNP